MSFLDKAKSQATKVAQKAQEGVKAGQEKIEDAQTKRKIDGLMRDLGEVVFTQRTGGGNADADIDRLVAEIRALQEEAAD